jgi:RNA polymerase sigma factor (sigma-70 family)
MKIEGLVIKPPDGAHSRSPMSTAEFIPAVEADATPLPSGFEALYTDHYDFLWRCALRLGTASADVEDVVQETFVVALRRYDRASFEAPGAGRPSTWLFAILHNVLRNQARSERRRQARLELLAVDEPSRSPFEARASLGLCLLDEFLSELEPDRRVVFVLAELEGMRSPEIARTLGVNPNTIRSRLRAARHAFEHRFGDEESEKLAERAAEVRAPAEARACGLALLGSLALPPSLAGPIATKGALGWLLGARGLTGAVIGSVVLVGAVVLGSGPTRGAPSSSVEPRAVEVVEPNASRGPAAEPSLIDPSLIDPSLIDPSRTDPSESPTAPIEVQARKSAPRATPQRPTLAIGASETEAHADPETEARDVLARARRALLDGDAATALALVEAPDNWPATLDAHRVALEIGALCTLDRSQQARARAQAWQLAHPNASTTISLRAVCWDDNSSSVGGHLRP